MKQKFKLAYMENAYTYSRLSTAIKLQVGAVIVKNENIISYGYNGTPRGWDNVCERVIYPDENHGDYDCEPEEFAINFPYVRDDNQQYALKTKSEVIHAEMNALYKLARGTESGLNAVMFITHSPCLECAKGIVQAGIAEVYYTEEYRSTDGIKFLQQCGIKIEKL